MNFSPAFPPAPPGISPEQRQIPASSASESRPPLPMEREWDPLSALASLVRAWPKLAGIVALAVGFTWLALSFWPKYYTAETLVLLDPRNQPNLQLDEIMTGFAPDDQTISSEVLILQSAALASQVIGDLELASDPFHNPQKEQTSGLLAGIVTHEVWQRLFRSSGATPVVAVPPEARLETAEVKILQAFADRLEVERVGRSHAIRVAFTAPSPEQAADIANSLADRYLAGQLSVKFEAHDTAQDWLGQRVAELQENVQGAEKAVEDYRTRSGLIDSNGMTVTNQQMGEINTRLIAARADVAAARARLAQVKGLVGREGDASSAAEVLSSPLIHRFKEQEVEVFRRRADLAQEYGARHPRMLSIEAELVDIRGRILSEVRQIVAGLNNEVAVAAAQERALARDLSRLESKTGEQNQAEVRLRALEREAEASRNLLEVFLARIKETSHQEAIQRSDARILSRALPPAKPSSPREILAFAAAAMGVLLLGVAYVLAMSVGRQGITDIGMVRSQLGLRVLGLVPNEPKWRLPWRPRNERSPADGAMALAAGSLRDTRSICIISVEDGSTTAEIATALCRSLARCGGQVLLVDGELDRADLSESLGLGGTQGFADILLDASNGPLPTLPGGTNGVRILSAGTAAARAQVAFTPASLNVGLARALETGGRMIVNGASVSVSADARLLAAAADQTVLVARWDHTPVSLIAESAAIVSESGGSLAGIIFYDVDAKVAPSTRAPRRHRRGMGGTRTLSAYEN